MRLRNTFVVGFFFIVHAAFAAGPEQIFGKWQKKLERGSLITEFSTDSVVLSQVDISGKPLAPAQVFGVTYKSLGHSEQGESFGVNFRGKDGKPGGGIMVFVTDADHILMIFPGAGAHSMSRIK